MLLGRIKSIRDQYYKEESDQSNASSAAQPVKEERNQNITTG